MVDDIVWLYALNHVCISAQFRADISPSTVEVNLGIFCGSLPILPPLFRQVLTKELIVSRYRSLVNLLQSSATSKHGGSTGKTSWPSHSSRPKEEYLELDDGAKVTAAATSRALHESF